MSTRYIDPTTDFGFKRLFGQEDHKELLQHFLYHLLHLPHPITTLTYLPTEQTPRTAIERAGIYDVYCTDASGQRFIVEMQRAAQHYYKERSLYYLAFPLTQLVEKGEGAPFALPPIYSLNILNFRIDETPTYWRQVRLVDETAGRVFYDKLTLVYVELPKFDKGLHELATAQEKWVYTLRHLPELLDLPRELAETPYAQAFAVAEQATLSETERYYYEGSLKVQRDQIGVVVTAHAEGLAEGEAKGRVEEKRALARSLLQRGMSSAEVAALTGLPLEVVQELTAS